MKINLLNDKLNQNPDGFTEVKSKEFFNYFFRLLLIKQNKVLSDNEINVLSTLCSGKELSDTGITKNNLPPVIKKLNEKGLMQGNGTYENTNEARYTNSIDKIFDEKGFTHKERKDGAEEPTFAKQWKERWTGKEKDNYKEVKETTSNAQGEAIDFG